MQYVRDIAAARLHVAQLRMARLHMARLHVARLRLARLRLARLHAGLELDVELRPGLLLKD